MWFYFKHVSHWETLKNNILTTDLIVDKLVFKDVQLTATNDDQYFVFEDILYQVQIGFLKIWWMHYLLFITILQVILCFSRDTEINQYIQSDLANMTKSKGYEGPPSGIVPFHGICMFGKLRISIENHSQNWTIFKSLSSISAAPFCYIFDSAEQLYFTFRAFYIRYCHRLTTINTHPQGIVSLCLLFEKLLQTHEPQLWSHFRELQIQP